MVFKYSIDIFRKHFFWTAGGILLIFLMIGEASALSNSGGGNWQYYRDITVRNSGATLTNYQVLVSLTGAGFPTNANINGADIRFEKAGVELPYWIEDWNSTAKNARVWVNVTNVPAGGSSIRMWYGKPNAVSSSNGANTFLFFDDFEDGIIDPLKWKKFDLNGCSGSAIESDGVLKLLITTDGISPPVLPSIKNFQDGILEFKAKVASSDSNVAHIVGNVRYDGHSVEGTIRWLNQLYLYDHVEIPPFVPYVLDNNWNFMQMKFSGNQILLYAKNLGTGFEGRTLATITTTNANPVGLSVWKTRTEDYFDDIRVRKFASPEPTVSVGTEQLGAVPVIHISTNIAFYSPGDTMDVTYSINNPTKTPVTFEWYIGAPQKNKWILYEKKRISAAYSGTQKVAIPVSNWGSKSLGMINYVQLLNSSTGDVLSQDSATFSYTSGSSKASVSSIDIEEEILKNK